MLGLSILKSKVVIIKNNNKIFVIAIVFIIRYCITECSYSYLLLSYYILAGIILLLILYIHSKKNIFIDGKDKLFIRCSKESITKCYF